MINIVKSGQEMTLAYLIRALRSVSDPGNYARIAVEIAGTRYQIENIQVQKDVLTSKPVTVVIEITPIENR